MNILGGAEVGEDWKHLKHVQQRIGVGTFLKVRGGGGADSYGYRLKLFRPKPHLPPKSIFSSDVGHFIFEKMPKMFR